MDRELQRIQLLYKENKIEDAIELLILLNNKYKNNAELLFELGKSYFIVGKMKEAVDNLLKSVVLIKTNYYAFELLAKSYKVQQKYFKSLRLFYFIKKQCNNINVDNEIINIYLLKNRYDLTLKFIHKLLKDKYDKKNEVFSFFISQISSLNANNETKKVKKYCKQVLNILKKDENIKEYNSILNELEISERKTFLKSYPRRLTVSLISSCNLRCKMCPYNKNRSVKLSQYQVNNIINIMPYLEEIEWNGGEVFLYKNFDDLLEKAYMNKVKQYITSNGILINDKFARQVVEYDIDLTLSIDSVNKDLYEYIRERAKFDILCKNIERINFYYKKFNKKSKLTINAVLSKWNYQQKNNFVDILIFAKENNFKEVRISLDKYERDKNILKKMINSFNEEFDKLKEYSVNNNINLVRIVPDTFDESSVFYEDNNMQLYKYKIFDFFKEFASVIKFIFTSFVNKNKDNIEYENRLYKNKLECMLPFKKTIVSFKGEFKPECVCIDFISKLSESKYIFFIFDLMKYKIFKYFDSLHLYYFEKYKREKEYCIVPIYRNIDDVWNSKELQYFRQQVYSNKLHCLKTCYLPVKVRQNI